MHPNTLESLRLATKPSVKIAVLIPCYNEAATIAGVIAGFQASLPGADITVYDNNSTDPTIAAARAAGAAVFSEPLQGKGNVIRRMFRDVEADFYLLVDGDGTYDAAIAPRMVNLALEQRLDLVNCVRQSTSTAAYRRGHQFGNALLTAMVKLIFGNRVRDMLSGYKLLSRRFVKSFPALAGGFDIETEITVHALELSLPIGHIEGAYRERPPGSVSKLSTYRDGFKIIWLILVLIKHERPIQLFCACAALLIAAAILLGAPVVATYFSTGLVPRLPTAVLATGLVLIATLSLATGIILDTVTRGRREARMLAYLQHGLPNSKP
jgi:glycosyltransferase involved in cell wall biosynthesis